MVALGAGAARAAEVEATSTPYPGISHIVYSDIAIPARIHLIAIDLTSAEITLHATTEGERGQTPSAFSAQSGAQLVINGDYFSPLDFATAGLAMGEATLWSGSVDDDVSGFLRFDRNGNSNHVTISPPEEVVDPAALAAGTQGVVGGRPMLVRSSIAVTAFDCTDLVTLACERAPRSAVAVSADGTILWLVVVDGWQLGSVGMTAAELGAFLADLGAYDALMFDGGAAAELYIASEGGVVSSPSDGVERVVANHLGVHHGALPGGQLVGFIRERDIFDTEANIEGATVSLDSGESDVTGADGLYSFADVTPHYACATAAKAGYRSETRCKQVSSGELVYNSMPLFPNSDFVDAAPGAPDASVADARPHSDAGPSPADASAGVDSGSPGVNGDCACQADGRRSTGGPLLLALLLALVIVLRKRS